MLFSPSGNCASWISLLKKLRYLDLLLDLVPDLNLGLLLLPLCTFFAPSDIDALLAGKTDAAG
jgi:hypothetical protein